MLLVKGIIREGVCAGFSGCGILLLLLKGAFHEGIWVGFCSGGILLVKGILV